MTAPKTFYVSEIAQHKSKSDCWLIIDERVLDVTKFLEEHPGGEEILIESAGKDATKEFKDIGHSRAAQKMLINFQVGVLRESNLSKDETETADDDGSLNEKEKPEKKEMSAIVLKDDPKPKYAAFLEFLVPILAAVTYFGYKCLTRAIEMQA